MADLKTWRDLSGVGVMLGVRARRLGSLAEELSALQEEWRESMSPSCVTLDFAGETFAPSIADQVGRLGELLPEALIAGINLEDTECVQRFGSAGGNFFTPAPGREIGSLLASASCLPWAYNAGDLRHGCYRLPPYHGINMMTAVRHWAECNDRHLIACYRGREELVSLLSRDLIPGLAMAGALAIEIWLDDLLEILPNWGLYGEPTEHALVALRQMKAEFVENMPR